MCIVPTLFVSYPRYCFAMPFIKNLYIFIRKIIALSLTDIIVIVKQEIEYILTSL